MDYATPRRERIARQPIPTEPVAPVFCNRDLPKGHRIQPELVVNRRLRWMEKIEGKR